MSDHKLDRILTRLYYLALACAIGATICFLIELVRLVLVVTG